MKHLRVEMYGDNRLRLLKTVAFLLILFVSYTFVATLIQISRAYANNKPIIVNRHAIIYPSWHMLSLGGSGEEKNTQKEEGKEEKNTFPQLPIEKNQQDETKIATSTQNPTTAHSDVTEGPLKEGDVGTTMKTTTFGKVGTEPVEKETEASKEKEEEGVTTTPSGVETTGVGTTGVETTGTDTTMKPTTSNEKETEPARKENEATEEKENQEPTTTPSGVNEDKERDLVSNIQPSSYLTVLPGASTPTSEMITPSRMTSIPTSDIINELMSTSSTQTTQEPVAETTPSSDVVEIKDGIDIKTSILDSKTTVKAITEPATSVKEK